MKDVSKFTESYLDVKIDLLCTMYTHAHTHALSSLYEAHHVFTFIHVDSLDVILLSSSAIQISFSAVARVTLYLFPNWLILR